MADDEDEPSPVEVALLARLAGAPRLEIGRRGVCIVGAPHSRGMWSRPAARRSGPSAESSSDPLSEPSAESSDPAAAGADPSAERATDVAAEVGGLGPQARLLEEGAGWLDAAAEVERGLAQLAGARVRALASFARCRPSSWDRQPDERGAASAASRAARPAVLTQVSEWAVAEVAARLRLSERTAAGLLAESVELAEQLPGTLAELEAGEISWSHARALAELLRPVAAGKKALVEARVLPRAGRQTVAQLRECTKRAVARIDADAAVRRLTEAIRGRKVTLAPGEEGMAVLTAVLPAPVARACHEAVRAYAAACAVDEDGRPDPRSLDQRMADCFADLFLRPDAEGRSVVRVLLTVIAGAGTLTGTGPDAEEPGEVDGQTVPAALVRELAYALGLMPRPTPAADTATTTALDGGGAPPAVDAPGRDEAATHINGAAPARNAVTDQLAPPAEDAKAGDAAPADTAPAEDANGGDAASADDANAEHAVTDEASAARQMPAGQAAAASEAQPADQLTAEAEPQAQARALALAGLVDLRRLSDTALAERPRIAVVDQLSGCLLALTDSIEIRQATRSGKGLSPPAQTDGYRPSEPLDRFVRLRDRRCRFPGCRARIRKCDLDHRVPYPHGPTAHTNLEGLCEHHHRLSHQAPGWQLAGSAGDGLCWTLPGGTTITTVPPRYGTDDGSTPTTTASAATSTASGPRWAQLTPAQRRAHIRALIDPTPTTRTREANGSAPF